jgi:hypothetical protein
MCGGSMPYGAGGMPYGGGRPMAGCANGAGVGAMVGARRGGAAEAMAGGAAAAAASLAFRFLLISTAKAGGRATHQRLR